MYSFLDFFLTTIHGCLVVFNLTGWLWRRTRRLHLGVIGLTILFWFGAGAFYGWGYCPLTDWHWQVKYRLGETGLPASYIKYYADRITGYDTNALLIDASVLVLGLSALALSLWTNWRDWRSRGGDG